MKLRLSFRSILRKELQRRRRINVRYSLRAFARQLGISPSRLSEILTGRYGLSGTAARALAQRLGLSDDQAAIFADLADAEHARTPARREQAARRIQAVRESVLSASGTKVLTLDVGEEVSLWGRAPFSTVAAFLSPHGATPYRSPAFGGDASIALVIRRSHASDHPGLDHSEFSALVLVADPLATTGYSIFIFSHLTDSPALIESRTAVFETQPQLCGRISLGPPYASVEDDQGRALVTLRGPARPDLSRVRGKRFTLLRKGKNPAGKLSQTRVTGWTKIAKRPFRPRTTGFEIQPNSAVGKTLKDLGFAPMEWNFSASKFEYFKR